MKLFIAGTAGDEKLLKKCTPLYVLESFYYFKPWQTYILQNCRDFLLDSGAFTFINNNKGRVNFNEYVDKYIKFINEHDIKHFFELDIDAVLGYQEVLQIRKKIEQQTKKKCIPVWHRSRGKEDFKRMCQEYSYVALGGLAIKEIKPKEYDYLYWFTDYAHKNNCKIHGLGFTGQNAIKYNFDTVDSTSWLQARRFGELSKFDGEKMIRLKVDKKTKKGKPEILEFNLKEWIKYQKYLSSLSVYNKTMRR